jgi:hypothetical protein
MNRTLVIILLSAILHSGCYSDKPDGLLSEPEYEKILVEMRMLSEYRMVTNDSLKASTFADSIFKASEIDPERFYRSHAWYESDQVRHAARLGRLADSLSALDTRLSTPMQ